MRRDDCRKIRLSDSYFESVDTPEKAYWLGFLLTDGNVHGTRVCVNIIDKDHLYLFGRSLGIAAPNVSTHYKTVNGKQFPIYRLQFRSKQMVADLAKLGVVPRKSAITVPWNGPPELMSHFWRGCVDGDGSVLEHKPQRFTISLCGTLAMVNGFSDYVKRVTGELPNVFARHNIFVTSLCSVEVVRALAQTLYSNASPALARKETIAIQAINTPTLYAISNTVEFKARRNARLKTVRAAKRAAKLNLLARVA